MRERRIEANGVELFTESFGDASHPPVLLLMGAMASGTWWPEAFCRALAERGRHVIRYDHRDTGRSTSYGAGGAAYTVEDLADDAVGILDAYGTGSAHFVGMSLGGILAQLAALKHPARVTTLTLIASQPLGPNDPDAPPLDERVLAYHARAAELDWSDREAVLDYQVGAWRLLSGSRHPFDAEAIRALAAEDLARTADPLAAMNHASLTGDEAWYGRLGEVRAPTLVIHGSEDRVIAPVYAHRMAESVPGARLVVLEGMGHELHRADWGTLLDAIEEHTG